MAVEFAFRGTSAFVFAWWNTQICEVREVFDTSQVIERVFGEICDYVVET